MPKWFQKFQYIGVEEDTSEELKRNIILCNSLSLFVAATPILFSIMLMATRGIIVITPPLIIQPFVLLTPVLLNAVKLTTLSRVILSCIAPAVIIAYSLYNKSFGIDLETSSYVGFRINLVAFSIMPFLLFSLREKWLMGFSLLICISFPLAFDAIHNLFNIGYYDVGLLDKSYKLTNIRAIIGIIIIGSCSLILKYFFENAERANESLIKQLGATNEEIQTQSEELAESYSKLFLLNDELNEKNHEIELQAEEIKKTNITLEKRVEERTNQLNKSYLELETFFYRTSHDFRRPLTTYLGLVEVAKATIQNEEALSLFERVKETTLGLDNMLAKLQSISQLDTEDLRTVLNISHSIRKYLLRFSDKIQKEEIEIRMIDDQQTIITNELLFKTVVENIIENSVNFCANNNPFILISIASNSEKVNIIIEDNGQGIQEQLQSKVFEMYFRANESSKGNGLGLYIARRAVEKIGGEISFTSVPKKGSKFVIELPK